MCSKCSPSNNLWSEDSWCRFVCFFEIEDLFFYFIEKVVLIISLTNFTSSLNCSSRRQCLLSAQHDADKGSRGGWCAVPAVVLPWWESFLSFSEKASGPFYDELPPQRLLWQWWNLRVVNLLYLMFNSNLVNIQLFLHLKLLFEMFCGILNLFYMKYMYWLHWNLSKMCFKQWKNKLLKWCI